jgi:hypothetical protein
MAETKEKMSLKDFLKPDKNFFKDGKDLAIQIIGLVIFLGIFAVVCVLTIPIISKIYDKIPMLSIEIAVGILAAYSVMFALRIFFRRARDEDISKIKDLLEKNLLEKQNDILEEQHTHYGAYTLKDLVEEIRNLGENSELTCTIARIEEHLEKIKLFAELTEEHTCNLRNDYHHKNYYNRLVRQPVNII